MDRRFDFIVASMKRRRAKAVCETELPIPAGRAAAWQADILGVHLLLPGINPGAIARLTEIAKTYRDGRRMDAAKASRPDSRKSLDEVSDLASRASESFLELPAEQRSFLNEAAKEQASHAGLRAHANSLGMIFEELAELDLTLRLPSTPQIAVTLGRQAELMNELGRRLSSLPMDAEWELSMLEQHADLLPAPPPASDFLFIMLRNLSGKCQVASKLMKSVRGPRSDTHRMRAVLALKEEFERAGAKATHNTTDTTGHTGIGASSFDQLVYKFFEDVDPDETQPRGINDAISYACRQGRQARQSRKPKIDDVAWKAIVNLLIEAGVTNFSPDD